VGQFSRKLHLDKLYLNEEARMYIPTAFRETDLPFIHRITFFPPAPVPGHH
jgi:hypothetical protein